VRLPVFVLVGAVLVAATGGYLAVSAAASSRVPATKELIAFDVLPGTQKSDNPLFEGGSFDVVRLDGSGPRRVSHGVQPTWSPNGKQLAFVCGNSICSSKLDGSGRRQLTHARRGDFVYAPAWSPDGRLIAYVCGSNTGDRLCTVNVAGGAVRTLAFVEQAIGRPLIWSPDSKRVLGSNGSDSYVATLAPGSVERLSFLSQRFAGAAGVEGWTPDDRIVFSTRTLSHNRAFPGGAVRLYSVLPNGSGQRLLPASVPVRSPKWSPEGQEFLEVTHHPFNLRGLEQLWTVAKDGKYLRKVIELPTGDQFLVFAWQP